MLRRPARRPVSGLEIILKRDLLSPRSEIEKLDCWFAARGNRQAPRPRHFVLPFARRRKIIHPRDDHEGNRYASVPSFRPPRPPARKKFHRCLAAERVTPPAPVLCIFWQFTSRAARSVAFCRVCFCVTSPAETPNFLPRANPSSAATRSVRTLVLAGLRSASPLFLDSPHPTCHCSTRRQVLGGYVR